MHKITCVATRIPSKLENGQKFQNRYSCGSLSSGHCLAQKQSQKSKFQKIVAARKYSVNDVTALHTQAY